MTRAGGISGNRLPPRRYGSVETPDVPRDAAAFVARRAPKSCSGCTPEQHAAQGTFAAGIETSCTGVRRRRGRTAAGSREGPLPALRASVTGRHLRAGGDASPPRLRAQRAARARPLRCVAGVEAEGPDSDSNLIEPANVPLAWMPVTVRHQVSHVIGALQCQSSNPPVEPLRVPAAAQEALAKWAARRINHRQQPDDVRQAGGSAPLQLACGSRNLKPPGAVGLHHPAALRSLRRR